jgi:hypothetical protein
MAISARCWRLVGDRHSDYLVECPPSRTADVADVWSGHDDGGHCDMGGDCGVVLRHTRRADCRRSSLEQTVCFLKQTVRFPSRSRLRERRAGLKDR